MEIKLEKEGTAAAESAPTTPLSFETSLKELERIVGELERGEQPLENQLKAFEKGVALSRECLKRLEELEHRVEILVQTSEDKLSTSPFGSPPLQN